jgi:Zn-dependent peptidase ImmA (M78 family)
MPEVTTPFATTLSRSFRRRADIAVTLANRLCARARPPAIIGMQFASEQGFPLANHRSPVSYTAVDMVTSVTGGGRQAMRPAEMQANALLHTAWRRASDTKGFVIPVNPFHIAQRLGIEVLGAGLEQDVSGMLVKEPAQDPIIYVNATDSENRQRFSCAHELGHFILRASSRADDSYGYIDRRGPLASQGTNPAEIYANQFAAELLMPQENVRTLAPRLPDAALAVEFNVSVGAMKYRLENLGVRP